MITVTQMAAMLSHFPGELPVVVHGYTELVRLSGLI